MPNHVRSPTAQHLPTDISKIAMQHATYVRYSVMQCCAHAPAHALHRKLGLCSRALRLSTAYRRTCLPQQRFLLRAAPNWARPARRRPKDPRLLHRLSPPAQLATSLLTGPQLHLCSSLQVVIRHSSFSFVIRLVILIRHSTRITMVGDALHQSYRSYHCLVVP